MAYEHYELRKMVATAKRCQRWEVHRDGKVLNRTKLRKHLGTTSTALVSAIHRCRGDDDAFSVWANTLKVKRVEKLHYTQHIYWRDECPLWSRLINNMVSEVSTPLAGQRLKQWSRKLVDIDEVCRPPGALIKRQKKASFIPERYNPPPSGTHLSCLHIGVKGKVCVFVVNGKEYSILDFTKHFFISMYAISSALYTAARNLEEFNLFLDNAAWRHDNAVNQKSKVYINPDSERHSITTFTAIVLNISDETARKRLRQWAKGFVTTGELLETATADYEPSDLSHIEAGDLVHLSNKPRSEGGAQGMGTEIDKILHRTKGVYEAAT